VALVRYVPGPKRDFDWEVALVDEDDPSHYTYRGSRIPFPAGEPLSRLVAQGRWMRFAEPDLEMDEGL